MIMKKILSFLLLFVLSTHFILAQTETINIEKPNVEGLSNNQVSDFDVNADGTILNNSATGGLSELNGTNVFPNPNIKKDSEAKVILFQVTENNNSGLDGKIEVFGVTAGVIIANPNGITCNGCGFINASKVDLVTGTVNTEGGVQNFIINGTGRFVTGTNGFEGDAVLDELNIRSGDYTQSGAIDIYGDLNIQVSGEARLDEAASIESRNLSFSANSISNQADFTITDSAAFDIEKNFVNGDSENEGGDIIAGSFQVTGVRFSNYNATITADSFTVTAENDFYNDNSATINAGSFTATASELRNRGTINAGSFLVVTGVRFTNDSNATINADSFNVTAENYFYNENSATINADSFTATASSLTNKGTIAAYTLLDITLTSESPNSFTNNNGNGEVTSADTFNLSVGGNFDYKRDFLNNGTINTNSFNLNVGGNFSNGDANNDFTWGGNNSLNVSGNADITTRNFTQYGVVNVDGIFTINANSFVYDANNDFTWGENNKLNVTGTASVIANSFNNRGTLNANSFDITATDLTNTGTISANTTLNTTLSSTASNSFSNTGGVASANTFNLSVGGDFDYVADRGTITANNFSLNVGGNFSNNDAANNFTWGANDSLVVSGTASVFANSFNNRGTVNANSFDITATDLTNTGTISANTTLNTTLSSTANNSFSNTGGIASADTFNLSVGGDFDYISNFSGNGTINSNSFNLNVGGDFRNEDANDDFTWGANDSLVVAGAASVIADSFNNSGTLNANSFNITATDLTNTGTISANTTLNTTLSSTAIKSFSNTGGIASADTFNLSVAGDFNYIRDFLNNGTINSNSFNLNVGGDFRKNDEDNDFTWGENNSLNVTGTAYVIANSFNNSGTLNASSFNITATDLNNTGGTINADNILNTTLTSTADNSFSNTGGVVADTFNLSVAGDFNYISDFLNNGTINTNSFNLNVGGNFSNDDAANDFTWGENNSLNVTGTASVIANNFNNSGTLNANSFDITATDLTNTGTISANTTLNTTLSSTASNSFSNTGGIASADTFELSVAGNFNYISDFLNNGTINSNSFNLNVGGDFRNNDANNDFTWGANDSLVVAGTASVIANNFNNSGTLNANSFDITATDITNTGTIIANTTLNTTLSSTANKSFSNTGGIASADTFNLSVAGNFNYISDFLNNGTINSNSFNLNVGGDFTNEDAADDFTWGANDSLVVSGTAYVIANSFNNSGTLNANSFNITATDLTNTGTISANTTLNTTLSSTAIKIFSNTGGIASADTFNLSVAGNFNYISDFLNNGTIDSNSFNLNVGGNFSNNDATNDFTWGANDSLVVSGTASVIADSFNNSGTLNANSFDITATDLTNTGTISANTTLNTTLSSTASNSFSNTGGVASADTFNLSVGGDFDYVADRGTINTNNFNLNVGGDFSNNDAANDFTWGANDSLVVSGDADIATRNFTQSGVVDVGGTFTINADGLIRNAGTITTNALTIDTDSIHNPGNITANTSLNITADGLIRNAGTITTNALTIDTDSIHNPGNITANTSLNITAINDVFSGGSITTSTLNIDAGRNFANHGSITANNSFEITSGNTVQNHGSIVSDSLDIIAADYFRNLSGGDISVDTLNITAGGKVTNIATITAGTLNITANNDSSRTGDTTGFYVANRGDIQATTLNITAADNFYNRGDITANTFAVTAKNIFFLNTEIASFYASGGIYDGGDVYLTGTSSFTATDRLDNYGLIDLNDSNLDITADIFVNQEDATIDATTLNLNVNSFSDEGTITATTNNQ